jgi:hypothetical protein
MRQKNYVISAANRPASNRLTHHDQEESMPSWREDITGDADPAHTVDRFFGDTVEAAGKAAITAAYLDRLNAVLRAWDLVLHPDGDLTGHRQSEASWRAISDAVDEVDLLDLSEALRS